MGIGENSYLCSNVAKIIDYLTALDEIAEEDPSSTQSNSQSAVINPIREIRTGLDKLVAKIDSLEPDFDRLAEKSSECLRLVRLLETQFADRSPNDPDNSLIRLMVGKSWEACQCVLDRLPHGKAYSVCLSLFARRYQRSLCFCTPRGGGTSPRKVRAGADLEGRQG